MDAHVLDVQRHVIRSMTAEQKVRASETLRAAAWDLKAAWIRSRHPEWSESAVQDVVRRWFRDAAG